LPGHKLVQLFWCQTLHRHLFPEFLSQCWLLLLPVSA
jgi:hypothetical protein